METPGDDTIKSVYFISFLQLEYIETININYASPSYDMDYTKILTIPGNPRSNGILISHTDIDISGYDINFILIRWHLLVWFFAPSISNNGARFFVYDFNAPMVKIIKTYKIYHLTTYSLHCDHANDYNSSMKNFITNKPFNTSGDTKVILST